MIKLTKRQQEVLDCVKSAITQTGFPPTRAEIAQQLGFKSANAAEDHLRALARKGVIEIIGGTSRGLRLVEDEVQPEGLPIIGQVAAGNPILAEQHIDSYAEIPTHFFKPSADYLLNVRGDSMINAGIFDGDLVAVKSGREANNGEIVVARLEDEVTVKRFRRKSNEILLEAENPDFSPIRVGPEDAPLTIEGRVVGVIRRSL